MSSSPDEDIDLTDEQFHLLYEANQLDDPVVLERDVVDDVRAVLGAPLEHNGIRDPSEMPLAALAAQFIERADSDDDAVVDLAAFAQQPETGGAPAQPDEGGAGGASLADLEADERAEVRDKLRRADLMAERTPEYAETLRVEAASIVGVDDHEEIDVEAL